MGTQAVDFGPPPKQAVDFGPPPKAPAVDFGPPPVDPESDDLGGTQWDAGDMRAMQRADAPAPVTAIPRDLIDRLSNAGIEQNISWAPRPDVTAVRHRALPQPVIGPDQNRGVQRAAFPTPADRLLSGQTGDPLIDVTADALTGRSKLGKALGYTPLGYAVQQGVAGAQAIGHGQFGRGLLHTGLGVLGVALANPAGAPLGAATEDAGTALPPTHSPLVPEALSPTINETPPVSAAARAVRETLNAPKPARSLVTNPAPSPVQEAMQWDRVAQDASVAPEIRTYAATRAAAMEPAARRVLAERATVPFPEETPTPAPTEAPMPPAKAPAPGAGAVVGTEASPAELDEMFSLGGLTSPQRRSIGQVYRAGLVDPYSLLNDTPQEQSLRNAMWRVGASNTYAGALGGYGVGAARARVLPDNVPLIEAQINADNMLARAAAREQTIDALTAQGGHDAAIKTLTEEAKNLRGHAAYYQSIAGDIRHDPDFGKYVETYNQVVTPRLKRMALQGGLPEDRLLSIPNGSPYVPTVADIERVQPVPPVAPRTPMRAGTKLSSATKRATGGAEQFINDLAQQVTRVGSERQRVAAMNEVWQRVRDLGRPVAKDAPLEPGEALVAFTDKNQITTPKSPNATQFVAVPGHVAQSVRDFLVRVGPETPPASAFGRALAGLGRGATRLATKLAPVITKVHGTNIGMSVGGTPTGSVVGDMAASLPGAPLPTAVNGLRGIDFTDPVVASRMIDLAEEGGTHPIATDVGGRALFGAQGLDARGRYALAERRLALHPEESTPQVARYLTERLGNYNRANQPDVVRLGQRSQMTSFAPAGVAFTRSAARQVLPIFPGMTPYERVATLGRNLGASLGTAEAIQYLYNGKSTFSNPPGHRLDIDRGATDQQGKEKYWRFGAIFPFIDRGLRMTAARGLIEGEGVGALRGPINEIGTQLGIVPRMGLGLIANAQPRLNRDWTPTNVAAPSFNLGNTALTVAGRSIFGGLGGSIAAVGGLSPYSANQSIGSRAASAAGINFGTTGPAPGKRVVPTGYDDKLRTAIGEVARATTMADKQAVINRTMRDAEDAGYSGWYLENLRRTLARTAGKTMPRRSP